MKDSMRDRIHNCVGNNDADINNTRPCLLHLCHADVWRALWASPAAAADVMATLHVIYLLGSIRAFSVHRI